MIYTMLLMTVFSNTNQKKTRGIRITSNIIDVKSMRLTNFGCCDEIDLKPKQCETCYIFTKLDFGSSIMNQIIQKSKINNSVKYESKFSFETFIQYSEKKNQKIYFSEYNEYSENSTSPNGILIDELINYVNVFDMDMKCNPCYSIGSHVLFYGYIRIFTRTTNRVYRSLVFKILSVSPPLKEVEKHCTYSEQEGGKSKKIPLCNFCFGLHSLSNHGDFNIINNEVYISKRISPRMNYYLFYDVTNSKIFENRLQQVQVIIYSINKTTSKKSVMDLWVVNKILLKPYTISSFYDVIGFSGIIKLSFSIFFTTYGYTEYNLFIKVNIDDPLDKIRSVEDKLKCADPNRDGKYCRNDKSICKSRPCGSRTKCIGTKSDYFCNCVTGPETRTCKKDINFENLHNHHNFMCTTRYNCLNSCNQGWTGEKCNLRSCDTNKCTNGADCSLDNNKSLCFCKINQFAGPLCQYRCVDICVHGICSIQDNEIKCMCDGGYTGIRCQSKKFSTENNSISYAKFIGIFFLIILFWLMIFFVIICYLFRPFFNVIVDTDQKDVNYYISNSYKYQFEKCYQDFELPKCLNNTKQFSPNYSEIVFKYEKDEAEINEKNNLYEHICQKTGGTAHSSDNPTYASIELIEKNEEDKICILKEPFRLNENSNKDSGWTLSKNYPSYLTELI